MFPLINQLERVNGLIFHALEMCLLITFKRRDATLGNFAYQDGRDYCTYKSLNQRS